MGKSNERSEVFFALVAPCFIGAMTAWVAHSLAFRPWLMNRVGLFRRLGPPWSELVLWLAAGAGLGLVWGIFRAKRLLGHERAFRRGNRVEVTGHSDVRIPELSPSNDVEFLKSDPALAGMSVFDESARNATRRHDVSHRMVGAYRNGPIDVFDLTTLVCPHDSDAMVRTLRRTFFVLGIEGLPEFHLRPMGFLRRTFGGTGILFDPRELESSDEFACVSDFQKAYDVGPRGYFRLADADRSEPSLPDDAISADPGELEERLRALFTPAVMREWIRNPGWSAESHSGRMALWRGSGWFVDPNDRLERLAEAISIADALISAQSGQTSSRPVPRVPGDSLSERLLRRQISGAVGGSGGMGGFFLGFALFAAMIFGMQEGAGAGGFAPRAIPSIAFFPAFLLLGVFAGAALGVLVGRRLVFPAVRDCSPDIEGLAGGGGRFRLKLRFVGGIVAGFLVGGFAGAMLFASLPIRNNRSLMVLQPLLFFGLAAIGLFAGGTVGTILEIRSRGRKRRRTCASPNSITPA